MNETPEHDASSGITTLPDPAHDHIQGPADAPIKLLEYGDFECPSCGRGHALVKALQLELSERLCFAFRHFPLTGMHLHAEHAAEAAEAAAAQGKFWEMHDLLFENQGSLEDDDLERYALTLGLDAARVMDDVLSGAYTGRIREDLRSGARGGVNGTPTFFINGKRYDGIPRLENMLAALTRGED